MLFRSHEAFSETELIKLKAQHPGAPVAAHPECPAHIVEHAEATFCLANAGDAAANIVAAQAVATASFLIVPAPFMYPLSQPTINVLVGRYG